MNTQAPEFFSKMLLALLAPFFVVMAVAFVSIPQSLGGHPGEARVIGANSMAYHPT